MVKLIRFNEHTLNICLWGNEQDNVVERAEEQLCSFKNLQIITLQCGGEDPVNWNEVIVDKLTSLLFCTTSAQTVVVNQFLHLSEQTHDIL